MDFFTSELVSKVFLNCYPNNSLSSSTKILLEQKHLEGEWEAAISETSYPSLLQNVTEEQLKFVGGHISSEQKIKIEPIHVETELYSSLVVLVVAMDDKVILSLRSQ